MKDIDVYTKLIVVNSELELDGELTGFSLHSKIKSYEIVEELINNKNGELLIDNDSVYIFTKDKLKKLLNEQKVKQYGKDYVVFLEACINSEYEIFYIEMI
jgi:hypothetical protein